MKNRVLTFLLVMIFTSLSYSQTVDEILAEHFNAVGQEKLLATNTLMMKGKSSSNHLKFLSRHFRKDQ